ncbi:MAG: hypothetical protein JSS42_06360 [Proteobacteria bacterium]|uniref:hypothetical protein n=1 Tax=Rudaea sp. TaxID=2136325 RepID=UPI0032204E02|nr:hypothetical protein [Pseudomonadota bacterium]
MMIFLKTGLMEVVSQWSPPRSGRKTLPLRFVEVLAACPFFCRFFVASPRHAGSTR